MGLLEIAAVESNCDTFGLRMAESRRLSDFGALSLLIAHQASVRQVLATLGRYRYLLNETLALQVEETERTVIIRENLLVTTPDSARHAHELAIGVLVRIFRGLLGERWRPMSVNLAHGPPADLAVHYRILGPDVVFYSDFNAVVCSSDDLDRVNPAADSAMADYARTFVDMLPLSGRRSLASEVRQTIHLLLPAGHATLNRVAESVGVPARTLQRRLATQGSDFRQMVDDVRGDLALRFVADQTDSLTRVSQLLGYSQSSAFSRWFHSKFGLSPTAWRKTRAKELLTAQPIPHS